MTEADSATLSIAAFTALGTIVGYTGTEVACSSIFDRLLWPYRFSNISDIRSVVATAFYHPAGGPIHKAAVETLDLMVRHGLFLGHGRGDMLGTAFFHDAGQQYRVHALDGPGPAKDARNCFWMTVMSQVSTTLLKKASQLQHNRSSDDKESGPATRQSFSQRPVFVLNLDRASAEDKSQGFVEVNGDLGSFKIQHLVSVVASEAITLGFGIATVAIWRTPFASWYLVPLILKLMALALPVRRTTLTEAPPGKESEQYLCEVSDISGGFWLIQGPAELLNQFFRHYGHPLRSRKGLLGDRVREGFGIALVILFALVYPAGLLVFIFASMGVQWTWLGSQLVTVISMHLYRYGKGEVVGTVQEIISKELSRENTVHFDDGSGNGIVARVSCIRMAPSVSEGRKEVASLIQEILHADTQEDKTEQIKRSLDNGTDPSPKCRTESDMTFGPALGEGRQREGDASNMESRREASGPHHSPSYPLDTK